MKSSIIFVSIFNIISVFAATCNQPFGQCGGNNWNGVTCCTSGYTCKVFNTWYSQCVPSSDVNTKTTSKTTTKKKTTKTTTKKVTTKSNKTTTSTTKTKTQSNQTKTSTSNSTSNVIGYASMNGGTTGGNGGQTTEVSNQSQLENALKGTNAKIIKVNGIVKLSSDVTVNSNTSIIGVNKNSGFTGAGLKFKSAKNIIIQNLKFSYCLGSNKDCINAQKSTNVWIDHCEFFNDRNHGKDYYDGLIDFTHASDYITISWNYIHDHYKASLVGHSDSNASEDTGKLHVTYHHNYFKNVGSRLPSLRFGTGHIYNNVYENIESSSVNIRMGAKALVEGNVFRNANKPISTNLDSSQEGSVIQRNNNFGSTANTNSITNTNGLSSVPYQYSADNVSNVYNTVVESARPQ